MAHCKINIMGKIFSYDKICLNISGKYRGNWKYYIELVVKIAINTDKVLVKLYTYFKL